MSSHHDSGSKANGLMPVSGDIPAGALVPMAYSTAAAPQAASAVDAAPTFSSLLSAFRRRWLMATTLGILGAAAAALLLVTLFPPQYPAEVRMLISAKNVVSPITGIVSADQQDFIIFKKTQEAMLRTPSLLDKALDEYLDDKERAKKSEGRKARDLSIVRSKGSGAVSWLERALKTDWNTGPEILRVQLSADEPEEVAQLLNVIMNTFVENYRATSESSDTSETKNLKNKLAELDREINDLERRIVEMKIPLSPTSGSRDVKIQHDAARLARLEADLNNVEKDLIIKMQNRKSWREFVDKPELIPLSGSAIDAEFSSDKGLGTFDERLKKLDQERVYVIDVSQGPVREQLLQGIEEKRSVIYREINEYKKSRRPMVEQKVRANERREYEIKLVSLETEIQGLELQQKKLKEQVEEAQREAGKIPGERAGGVLGQELLRKYEDKKNSRSKISEQIEHLVVADRGKTTASRVQVLETAKTPREKDVSRTIKIAGAGSAMALLGCVALVSFSEFRTRKISAPDDVSKGLGLPLLGTVPPLPDKVRRGLATAAADPHWQAQLNESIDTLRTLIMHSSRNNSTRVIMVSSAQGGEGKTSLASQLAASLARAWKKTLLIDGDLRNPANHKLFGLPLEPGLSEVLRGEVNVAEAVQATPVGRLWLLSAGHWDNHAIQALAQEQVRTMLEQIKQQYDFVIVDSSPILPVADALLLAQHVDGVLLSVMRDVSRAPAVHAAKTRLDHMGVRTIGAVLIGTKSDLATLSARYSAAASS
jgi:capsular exopolysaccharide synthesis family protein